MTAPEVTSERSTASGRAAVKTMAQAIAATLDREMSRDPNVVIIGEDVGKRGGVFLATDKLFDKYGPDRVIDSPLSEAAIIGAALGMAVYGLRPVAEIQFSDYVFPGFDQLVSQVAKIRYRSGGVFSAPLVVRMPAGGGVRGGHHHSQNPDAHFVHTAGLKVVYPSTPSDSAGLLRSAIRDDDPVIVMEPKRLYRSVKEEVPEDDHLVEIGRAAVRREGEDVVLVSYGGSMAETLKAADALAEQGVGAQVIDLRSLQPWDEELVLQAAARVGRVVLVSESPRSAGFMSEVSATISEEVMDSLLAPPLRVTGFDTPYPYAQDREYLPSPNRILRAVERALTY
ncbi:MAG TPA: alpha-ketoacid dehydrogenase subunit beta [Trueperaceae bacterium]|nr:alpha-ketoacid dehydrogenase subunit beta [Trueperaceae bacterium]